MSETISKPSVPFYQYERISIKEAAEACHVSIETIRLRCRDFGIGEKFTASQWRQAYEWRVSYAAAMMVQAQDQAAFDAFCLGDRSSVLVERYLYENRFDY